MSPDFTLRHHAQRGYGLYTKKSWKKGEKILMYEGRVIPSCMAGVHHSMTLTEHFSFEWNKGSSFDYPNHSCKPNCYIDLSSGTPVLMAFRDISSDEELCYNYNTVEVDLSKDWLTFPFHCGNDNCIGWIKGFLYLTPKLELEILEMCSLYIKQIREEYEKSRD
jgi:uncharacterized protein